MTFLETKIPPPFIFVICATLMWIIARTLPSFGINSDVKLLLMGSLSILAVALGASGVFAFKKANTTVNPHSLGATSSLVLGGVYKFTRNPMYLGLAVLLLTWGIYLQSYWSIVGIFIFVLYINRFQILPEERSLELKFGEQFCEYRSKVRRWI